MFTVQVAADIFGQKTNFELTFPSRPSLLELTRAAESAFSAEIGIRRADHIPQHSFHVAKFKAYDEDRNKWVDLLSEGQLLDFCQLYAFQPENPWHKETQKEIPAAVKPPTQPAARRTASTAAVAGQAFQTVTQSIQSTSYAAVNSGGSRPSSQAGTVLGGAVPRVSLNASEEEKLRIVFAEFDMKGNRMIDMEDLKQGFRTLGLEFSTATMNDLFQKGDLNSDGRISFPEFERFAKMYPIMMDCLFYRSKAFWDEENMNREIQAEKEAVRHAHSLVQQQAYLQAAQKTLDEANDAIIHAEADLKDRSSRLRDIAKDTDLAQRERDRLQKERFDKESDLAATRDRERATRQLLQETSREVEKLERRAVGVQQEAQKAEDRVKQLQQQLIEAQRAAERAQQIAKSATVEVDGIRSKEKEIQRTLESILRELPKVEDMLRASDLNLQSMVDRQKELEMLTRDISREAEEANRRRDAGERAAAAAREQEAQIAQELERSRRAAEERERQAKVRESELLEQQRQRQLVTQQERALIEQELRLREQRETLEEKETRLKQEASGFLSNLRQAMTATRSYSRDTSAAEYYRGSSGY
jgi:hypothetical protein